MSEPLERSILEDHGARIGRFLTATRSLIQVTRDGHPTEGFELRALQLLVVAMIRRAMDKAMPKPACDSRERLLEAIGTRDGDPASPMTTEQTLQRWLTSASPETVNEALLGHLADPWAQVDQSLTNHLDMLAAQAVRDGYHINGLPPEVLLLLSGYFKASKPLFGW